MVSVVRECIDEKINILNDLKDSEYMKNVIAVSDAMIFSLMNGGKILTAGNGGSAADAQHFSGEMIGRFLVERDSYASVCLVVDPVVMTSVSNDYGYENAVARQLAGIGREGDVLLAISTSGESKNMINAIYEARKRGIISVALTGKDGGMMAKLSDYSLIVPSENTPRIQEIHTFTIHLLCELIEREMSQTYEQSR